MALIRAHESTKNTPSGRNMRDVARGIHYLDPDAAPLTAFITKAATRKVVARNPKFEWNEKGLAPKADQVNNGAGYLAGDTALVVDNADRFGVNDIVEVLRTGEVMRVSAVNTGTNTVTVARGVGSTAAAALVDDDDVLIIGNAWAEGAAKGTPRSHPETTPFNYTQIFRHQFGETRTQANTQTYIDSDGSGRQRLRMEKAIEHKVDIERAFLFGERNEDATDTNSPVRYTGGLDYWLSLNTKNVATLTEAEIEDWLEDVFAHSSSGSTRLLLASPKIISVLGQLAAAKIQTVSGKNQTYGLSLSRWVTGHGDLLIVRHPLLTDGAGGEGYSGFAFAVDPSKVRYRFLQNSDTKLNKDIQDAGDDRWTDEYLSEVGLEVANPENHGQLTGVTG